MSILVLESRWHQGLGRAIAERFIAEGFDTQVAELDEELRFPSSPEKIQAFRNWLASEAKRVHAKFFFPGISDWALRPEVPLFCHEIGITYLGPSSRVLTMFSNRLGLLESAAKHGIPTLLLEADPIHSVRELERLLERFPHGTYVLRAVQSGERGQALYDYEHAENHSGQSEEKQKALEVWIEELRLNHGEAIFYVERSIDGARRIRVPFVSKANGESETFPALDISLRTRYGEVASILDLSNESDRDDQRNAEKIRSWIKNLAIDWGYRGIGAMDFLIEGDRAFLIDGFPHLTPDFLIWEPMAGRNIAAIQLESLELADPKPAAQVETGFSGLLLHLRAEDPLLQLPQPGWIEELGTKRIWSMGDACAELFGISKLGPSSDRMGFLWVHARIRSEALQFAQGVLQELWFAGTLETNERFLAEVLAHPWVREGIFHAGFIEEEFVCEANPDAQTLAAAAGISAFSFPPSLDQEIFWVNRRKCTPSEVHWVQEPRKLNTHQGLHALSGAIRLEDGRKYRVFALEKREENRRFWILRVGLWYLRANSRCQNRAPAKPEIRALVPGRVRSVLFRQGALVEPHQHLLIIECEGRLVPHSVPVAIQILDWKVRAKDVVERGQELLSFEVATRD